MMAVNGIIAPYLDKGGAVYNVKAFGVRGDGTTDDTLAIQAAIDAVGDAGGGVVFFPAGTYIVSMQSSPGNYNYCLRINHSNITIAGAGESTVIKAAPAADATLIRTAFDPQDPGISGRLANIEVRDILLDGDWDNQTWGWDNGALVPGVYDQNVLSLYLVDGVKLSNVLVRRAAQDGITLARCQRIRMDNVDVEDCGKNNIALFLCSDYRITNARCINANDSPDGGVTKDYYATSLGGYAGIMNTYPADWLGTGATNHGVIIAPHIRSRNARGIVVTENCSGIEIVSPDILLTGTSSRHGLSFGYSDRTVPSDIRVIGGTVVSPNDSGRAVSATNVGDLRIVGLRTHYGGTNGSWVLDTCGRVSLSGVEMLHEGDPTANTLDIRGCENVRVVSAKLNGRVFLNTAQSGVVTLIGVDAEAPIANRSFATDLRGGYNGGAVMELDGSVLRSNANISAGATETTNVPMVGVAKGDLVIVGHTNPSNVDKVVIHAQADTDAVNLKLYNPSGSNVQVGSGTWYFKVIKRTARVA